MSKWFQTSKTWHSWVFRVLLKLANCIFDITLNCHPRCIFQSFRLASAEVRGALHAIEGSKLQFLKVKLQHLHKKFLKGKLNWNNVKRYFCANVWICDILTFLCSKLKGTILFRSWLLKWGNDQVAHSLIACGGVRGKAVLVDSGDLCCPGKVSSTQSCLRECWLDWYGFIQILSWTESSH